MSRGLVKRAANVNKDYPFKVMIPAGTTCTGTMGGQSNVCLLKVANNNAAGPFGGVVAFQIANAAGAGTAAAGAAAPAASSAGTAAAPQKAGSAGAGTAACNAA